MGQKCEAVGRSVTGMATTNGASEAHIAEVTVGFALTEKKCRSLFSPELIDEARGKGVRFLPIDPSRPIEEQVRFSTAHFHNTST